MNFLQYADGNNSLEKISKKIDLIEQATRSENDLEKLEKKLRNTLDVLGHWVGLSQHRLGLNAHAQVIL